MNRVRALIDTNVLIALEDPGRTEPLAANFARRCIAGGIAIHVHQATLDDFNRDSNERRRSVSTSRIGKYPCLAPIPLPPWEELQARFGPIRTQNDRVDVALLHTLSIDAVDILVSQDAGLHRRVSGGALEERVLTLADAVAWLKALQDPVDDGLAQVEDVPAYSLNSDDPIFDSLRADYDTFSQWWTSKCIAGHRSCWVVIGSRGLLDGLVVRKSESADAVGLDADRRALKLCTFKVAAEAHGHKVGELLLRKALWHAQLNEFDAVYLTTYPTQTALLDLLVRYGFSRVGSNDAGELVVSKPLSRARLDAPEDADLAELARTHYPRFALRAPVKLFAIPAQMAVSSPTVSGERPAYSHAAV